MAPLHPNAAHIARLWGDRYGRDRRASFKVLGHLRPSAAPYMAELALERGASPTLRLGTGLTWAEVAEADGQVLPVSRLWSATRPGWVFAIDADEAWAVRVPEPEGPQ